MSNVLVTQLSGTVSEVQAESERIRQLFDANGIKPFGASLTSTSISVDDTGVTRLIIKMVIPVGTEVAPPLGCEYLPEFVLHDMLLMRWHSDVLTLAADPLAATHELEIYLNEHRLTAEGSAYQIIQRQNSSDEINSRLSIDVFVAIKQT